MINVNQITAQLAKMPDQALQQYAQMHKSDPYTVSLALSESNRRKQRRAAAQMPQGGEQPKVVDQELAQMDGQPEAPPMPQGQAQAMPEDTGIGALPAPNMQGMAEGGIVAFSGEDGSFVTDPQFGGYTPEALVPTAKAPTRTQAEVDAIVKALRARGETVGLPQLMAIQEGTLSAPAGTKTAIAPPVVVPPPKQTGGGIPDAIRKTAPPAAPAAPAAAATPPPADFRAQYLKDMETLKPEKPKTIEALKAERAALMPTEKAYAGLEASLKKEGEGAADEKQSAIWGAVAQAGLAAAAGKSRYALQNIAEGFGTGLAGYKESLKEFKKADKERQKAMADIEQARRAEARGDVDQAITMRERGEARMDKFADRQAAGLSAITGSQIGAEASRYATDVSAATSKAINAATIEAASKGPERMAFNAALQATKTKENPAGDPVAAYQKLMEMKREPISAEKLRADWLDPAKRMQLAQDYPNVKTLEDYMAVMGAGGGAGGGAFKVVGVRPAG